MPKRCMLFAFLLAVALGSLPAQNQFFSAASLLRQTQDAIAHTQTLAYRSTVWERLADGSTNESEMIAKVQNFPYKVYFYNLSPKSGVEVLYDTEKDKEKALINPNGFPWVNVRLDIQSKVLREGKHQTVERAGLRFIGNILQVAEARLRKDGKFEQSCHYVGQVPFEGLSCHLVEMADPDYHLRTYTMKEGETVLDIARNYHLNEYKILELNPKLKFYSDSKAGLELTLPSSYGKKTLLYIHPETFLIVKLEIFDEKGLYERYCYLDMKVNPLLTPDEFSEDYEGYGF